MAFAVHYDRTTKIVSSIVCLGFLGVTMAVHSAALACLSLALMLAAYAYSPRGYRVDGRAILVQRLAGTVRISLDDVREARKTTPEDFRGCLRLWGSGGLFGYYGLFRTSKLGKSTWYVTNRSTSVVLITGTKTVLFSPDDPDTFLETIRAVAPISPSYSDQAIQPFHTRGAAGRLIVVAATLAAIGLLVATFTDSPGVPRYTLTKEALTIHDRFYPVTLSASSIDVGEIRIVDLNRDAQWRPTVRTNGVALAHYRSGWYRVASGQRVRLYLADGASAVLLPPNGDGAAVLYQAPQLEKFVNEIRTAWSASPPRGAKAGK